MILMTSRFSSLKLFLYPCQEHLEDNSLLNKRVAVRFTKFLTSMPSIEVTKLFYNKQLFK